VDLQDYFLSSFSIWCLVSQARRFEDPTRKGASMLERTAFSRTRTTTRTRTISGYAVPPRSLPYSPNT
jgi:hypothetical protein